MRSRRKRKGGRGGGFSGGSFESLADQRSLLAQIKTEALIQQRMRPTAGLATLLAGVGPSMELPTRSTAGKTPSAGERAIASKKPSASARRVPTAYDEKVADLRKTPNEPNSTKDWVQPEGIQKTFRNHANNFNSLLNMNETNKEQGRGFSGAQMDVALNYLLEFYSDCFQLAISNPLRPSHCDYISNALERRKLDADFLEELLNRYRNKYW